MEEWKEGKERQGALGEERITAGAWVFYEVNSVADEDHTPKVDLNLRDTLSCCQRSIWQRSRTSQAYARDKTGQICRLSKAQFRMAWGGVIVVPNHSDTRPRVEGVLCHVM